MERLEKLTSEKVIRSKDYQGIVRGVPTGMYADRESYGNAPVLVLILDEKLPCKFRANPYSHRHIIMKNIDKTEKYLKSSSNLVVSFTPDDENENLAIASAFVDQSIRTRTPVEVDGEYKAGIFYSKFLKIGVWGFGFPGYKMPFEGRSE